MPTKVIRVREESHFGNGVRGAYEVL